MNRTRRYAVALLWMLLGFVAMRAWGNETSNGSGAMPRAAEHFLALLSSDQRARTVFSFDDPERLNWGYEPRERKGIALNELDAEQRKAALALLASGLSGEGVTKTTDTMSIERDMIAVRYGIRIGPDQYFVSIFGAPIDGQRWGVRFEGHHVAHNFTMAAGKLLSVTPSMLGVYPSTVGAGGRSLRVLGKEEDLGRQLVRSLNAEQSARAVVSDHPPRNVLSGMRQRAVPLTGGLPASGLTSEQRELLDRIVHEFIGRAAPEVSTSYLSAWRATDSERIAFVWMGSTDEHLGHYYRVQTPRFLLEYCNSNGIHVHTVWRDFESDFGG